MTERELYENALIEMNKVEAPSLLLEDYNYFINKAVQQYINKVYNRYDINQQSSDDLRVLKSTAEIMLNKSEDKRYSEKKTFLKFTPNVWGFPTKSNTLDKTISGITLTLASCTFADGKIYCTHNDSDNQITFKPEHSGFVIFNYKLPDPTNNNSKVYIKMDDNQETLYNSGYIMDFTASVKKITFRLSADPDIELESITIVETVTESRRAADRSKFTYSGKLPADYMHLLNCVVDFEVKKNFKCYRQGDYVEFGAKRLTADMAPALLHNYYMRPDYKRPYFYINNVNTAYDANIGADGTTDYLERNQKSEGEFHATNRELDSNVMDTFDNYQLEPDGSRVANSSEVRIEIRFGEDDTVFTPKYAYIDYIKAPMFIRLTYDDITSTEDHTRMLEFPDYVCFEIVNEFVKLLMENASDPRLQTNFAVNQTIGDPTVSRAPSQSKDKS